jgi:4-aminobutyrate aminotransferase-like enzyme
MSQFPELISEVRGRGLWFAVDLPPHLTMPIVNDMESRGVIVGSLLNAEGTVRIAPPLIVAEAELDVLTGVLRASLMAARAGELV